MVKDSFLNVVRNRLLGRKHFNRSGRSAGGSVSGIIKGGIIEDVFHNNVGVMSRMLFTRRSRVFA